MKIVRYICVLAIFSSATVMAQKTRNPLINNPLVPDAIAPGSGGFNLTVNGTGFSPRCVVKWNGRARATTFVNSSQLTAAILASDVAKPRTSLVTVVNPGNRTSNTPLFAINFPVSSFSMKGRPFKTAGIDHNGGITVADFNHDGKLDVAVAAGTAVSVLLGNGDGTFQPHVDYGLSFKSLVLTSADFNGDGKADLAVANGTVVSILLGNGDGTFGAHQDFDTVGMGTTVIAADFNGDGKLDLALSLASSNISAACVLLGNGDGTFQPAIRADTGIAPNEMVAGDFNRDGKLDLVTADDGGATYSVLLGNGNGTFNTTTFFISTCLVGAATADFNGDGILDLAFSHGCGFVLGKVSILLGRGDGSFSELQDFETSGQFPNQLVAGDFNNDGIVDLLVADFTAVPGILLGNGDGTFQSAMSFPTGAGLGFSYAGIGDANGDGKLDIFLGNTSLGDFTIDVMLQERP